MNKRVCKSLLTVTIVALLIMVTLCMVGCENAEQYEKRLKDKGYVVTSMTAEQIAEMVGGEEEVDEIDWMVSGMKVNLQNPSDGQMVYVMKAKSDKDAKDAEAEMKEGMPEGYSFVRKGKILIFGTEQAVNDVK